jgi:hypothetical protein
MKWPTISLYEFIITVASEISWGKLSPILDLGNDFKVSLNWDFESLPTSSFSTKSSNGGTLKNAIFSPSSRSFAAS